MKAIKDSRGWGEDVTDNDIINGIKLLAETEGIFTEKAGGVTVAVTQKLIKQGYIKSNESVLVSITGNGLKTQEHLVNDITMPYTINANLEEFEDLYNNLSKEDMKRCLP